MKNRSYTLSLAFFLTLGSLKGWTPFTMVIATINALTVLALGVSSLVSTLKQIKTEQNINRG